MGKWIIIIVLIAAMWGIVWFTGAPVWTASLASIAAVAGLSGLLFWRRLSAKRAAREIERRLRGQASEQVAAAKPEQRQEVDELRKEFERAVRSLRSSKLGKKGYDALYALPWFVIIGPPGAGKTTALRNSGLNFPYMSGDRGGIRGVGGTRNCDWWLCNEAILLDTAGRYTSEPDDQEEWLSFLDMLREHRPRKPLNGALIAIPLDELGGMSAEDAHAAGQIVRGRIDELNERLDMKLPVYVLFTKADLVPGFVETFNALKKSERGQIWGLTVPIDETPEDVEFYVERQIDQLLERLEPFTLRRFAAARRLEDRELILAFPQQFAALRDRLVTFLGSLFTENVFQETPRLRGFYFTSGVQEGRPIDRVMRSMSDAFGLREPLALAEPHESKSYFLTDLFAHVVFRDQELAVRSDAELRRGRRSTLLAASGILASAGLTLVLPGLAYWKNMDLIAQARRAAQDVASFRVEHPEEGSLPPRNLRRLQRLVESLHEIGFWTRVRMSFGMYAGGELSARADPLFGTLVERDVLAPLLDEDTNLMSRLVARYRDETGVEPDSEDTPEIEGRYLSYAEFRGNHDMLRLHLMMSRARAAEGGETEGEAAEPEDAAKETADADDDEDAATERAAARAELARKAKLLEQPPLSDLEEQGWLTARITEFWIAQEAVADTDANRLDGLAVVGSFLKIAAESEEFRAAFLRRRDDDLVADVRGVLRREVLSRRQVEGIEEHCRRVDYDLTLRDITGSVINVRSDARVRGVYTRRGWEDCVRDSIDGRGAHGWIGDDIKLWVLGVTSEDEALELDATAIRHAYLDRYADEWREFLRSVVVTSPGNHERALLMLNDLTGGGVLTPYARLFRVVDYNTRLEARPPPPRDEEDEGDDKGGDSEEQRMARLSRRLKPRRRVEQVVALAKGEDAVEGASQLPGVRARPYVLHLTPQQIRDDFIGFARFGAPPQWLKDQEAGGDAPPPAPVDLDIYIEQLSFARDAIQEFTDDPSDGDKLVKRLQDVRTRVRDLIDSQEAPWRARFEALLWPPVEGLTGSTSESIADRLSRRWCSDVVVYWDREMADRYPFNGKSMEDVKVDDFNSFFHPEKGTLWRFYKEALQAQIHREGDAFVFAKRLGRDYADVFDPAILEFLTAALDVTNASFPPGAETAEVKFNATVLPSPDIDEITVTLGGETIVHQNGPEQTVAMAWRSEDDAPEATVKAHGIHFQEGIEQGGSWALYRLLERGDVTGPGRGGRFTIQWTFRDQDKRSVRVVLVPAREVSPFFGVPGRGADTFLAPYRARALKIPRRLSPRADVCPKVRRERDSKRRAPKKRDG
ncbi:MAG: type VI secretion system membrane subunit TssM [Nannocystaceae bacterium]